MTAALAQTIVVLSGAWSQTADLAAAHDRVAAEIGDARHGKALAREVEEKLSRPAGDPIAAQDVAVLREATDSVFRVYAAGDWAPASETLERLRARIDASPVSLAADLSLRQAFYDIRVMLAECYRRLGREVDATATMAEVVRGDPKREPSSIRFSPDVIDFFKKVKRDLDAQPRGSLEVVTEPPGLAVTIGGEYVGQSPVKVGDLYPGRYRVIVGQGAGAGRLHEVTVQGDERVAIDHGFDRALRTRDLVAFAFANEGERAANEAAYAAKLGRWLGARQVVVLAAGVHQDRRALIGSLVDVETARATRAGIVATEPSAPTPETLRTLARFLARGGPAPGIVTSGAAFSGAPARATPEAEAAAGSSSARPFRVWKWVAAGVAVAALAAGGALMAMDGTCSEETRSGACVGRRDTKGPAIGALAGGGAIGIGAGVMFWLDAR